MLIYFFLSPRFEYELHGISYMPKVLIVCRTSLRPEVWRLSCLAKTFPLISCQLLEMPAVVSYFALKLFITDCCKIFGEVRSLSRFWLIKHKYDKAENTGNYRISRLYINLQESDKFPSHVGQRIYKTEPVYTHASIL